MKKLSSLIAVGLLALSAIAASAQGVITGSVTGTVVDPTGAIVSNAQVTVVSTTTGITAKTSTSSHGDFSLPDLAVGIYKVQIVAPGFDTLNLSNVSVQAGTATGLGPETLKVGSATDTLEVSTSQSLLETVQSQVTTTFDTTQVANLPTGGGFDELALLIPGDVSVHGNNRSNTNGASISSNGQRGRNNNFELDGQSNNDNSVAGPQIFFSNQDALAEVQVITDNYAAQYGRDAGSVVNYITKSGTNSIHGSAFEFYEGSWLSSESQGQKSLLFGICAPGQSAATTGCIPPHRPRFNDNTYGGTLGGPILKDRLFAFGSALFSKNINGLQYSNSSSAIGTGTTGFTPDPTGLAQLAAAYPTNAGVQSLLAYGPYAVNVGKVVPFGNTTKTILVSDGVKSTPVEVSQYQRQFTNNSTDEEVLGRLDYQATTRDRFFIRYFYQKDPSYLASGTASTGALVNVTDINHAIGADWTHTFSSRIVDQLRYSFQQSTVNFDGGAFPNCTVNNISSCPSSFAVSTSTAYKVGPAGLSTTGLSLGGFGLSTSYPQGRVVKDTQIQDNLTLTIGKHSMTMGGAFEYQNSPNTFLPNISGGFSIYGFDSLLSNPALPQAVGLAIGSPKVHFTEPDAAIYFQDDWKVATGLTLNLGLRWEYFGQSINLLNTLSAAQQATAPLWNTSLPASVTNFPSTPNVYRNFEPRIGFAYNPEGMKSLVIRGGYAINVSPSFYNIFLNSYGGAPVVLAATVSGCNNTTKLCIPNGGANYTSVHALDNAYLQPVGTSSTLNPGNYAQTLVGSKFHEPLTQTYSIGVQEQVGRFAVAEVRYVGAHTSGDFQSINANPNIAAAAAAFPSYFTGYTPCTVNALPTTAPNSPIGRINCSQTLVRNRTNTSFEIYNGLQTSLTMRSFHGLTATAAYTWSRTIDNASEIFSTNGSGTTEAFANNPLNNNIGERGVSGNSYPNVTSMSVTYVSQFMKQNHTLVGKLLSGFQFNSIYLFNSGQPYTPFQLEEGSYCDNAFNTQFNGSVDSCRPILGNPNAPLGTVGYNLGGGNYIDYTTGIAAPRSAFHWITNTTTEANALGNPYPGVSRNTLRGNTYNNVDVSVFKNNQLTERVNLQLQVTAFNALNRAYYGSPDPEIEDDGTTFGNFSGNGGTQRNVQLGVRVLF
jgi:hypothetical protein